MTRGNRRNRGYEKRILAFIDILGFEKLVSESENDITLIKKIYGLLDHTLVHAKSLSRRSEVYKDIVEVNVEEYAHHIFSDTIILSCPYKSAAYLVVLIDWMVGYQITMWENKATLIRGAITGGNLYEDRDMVFGPALVRAYHLERDKAVWPRVLVDKNVLGVFAAGEKKAAFADFLRQDENGLVFIDYLRDLCILTLDMERPEMVDGQDAVMHFLGDHKRMIEEAASNTSLCSIVNKYVSLAKYHNLVIDECVTIIEELVNHSEVVHDQVSGRLVNAIREHQGLPRRPVARKVSYTESLALQSAFDKMRNDDHARERFVSSEFDQAIRVVCDEVIRHLSGFSKALDGLKIEIGALDHPD